MTGALQTVKSDKLKDITTPFSRKYVKRKGSGSIVAPGSGQPGSGGAVVIRGQATFAWTTAPLWVIDGVIVGSNAGALNPSDIETMTTLKDAASTAIYGSQGANGVILVTTKEW
ncbi:TonB-dependent receptor plug domain-containing protein [Bacteroides fragilis]|nr:TonB-dependent receptor plug domain-containing protein [Bacteroides fragilis]